jgi:hypothetical protein
MADPGDDLLDHPDVARVSIRTFTVCGGEGGIVMPVVAVVGAFDRFNFGDLLFPHMVRFGFEKLGVEVDYRCYSIRGADLRDRGGVETWPLARLKRADHPAASLFVAAGGEILSARWLDAYAGLAGPRRTLAAKTLARLTGTQLVDSVCRQLLGGDRPLPWVFDAGDFGSDAPVSYNGVGGIGLDRLPAALRSAAQTRLSHATFLGVRDPATKKALDGWDLPLEVRLTPDPAVLVSEAFPKEELLPRASETTRTVLSKLESSYLVFQVGRYPAWGRVSLLAEQIRTIHRETGLRVLLLPLGQAPGHEDQVPLRQVAGLLEGLPVEHIQRPNLHDILSSIAHSRLFIGSSLHGNLTALVYGVPHVGFGERVPKLDLMLRTWDETTPDGAADLVSIADHGLRVLDADRVRLPEAVLRLQDGAMTTLALQARLI